MQYLAILGRQPKISLAELESLFSDVRVISPEIATFYSNTTPDINRLGGSLKLGYKLNKPVTKFLQDLPEGKITLGVSDYSKRANTRSASQEALRIKRILVRHGRSVRVLQNKSAALSTATVHHNQLGEKKNHVELIIVDKQYFIGLGAQNITAYAKRDQARPARDAKVGMLPPKLAQILINLCGNLKPGSRLLDPFCGTGVLLQEAALMKYTPYGTDLSERMIKYTERNLKWLGEHEEINDFSAEEGDAATHKWSGKIDAVAAETYLGPPMSQPPVDIKLKTVKQECGSLLSNFLKNLAAQIEPGTPVAIAVPAWLRPDGSYSRLNLLDEVETMGYNVVKYKNLSQKDLLYFRDGQVVAREIIVLRKK